MCEYTISEDTVNEWIGGLESSGTVISIVPPTVVDKSMVDVIKFDNEDNIVFVNLEHQNVHWLMHVAAINPVGILLDNVVIAVNRMYHPTELIVVGVQAKNLVCIPNTFVLSQEKGQLIILKLSERIARSVELIDSVADMATSTLH